MFGAPTCKESSSRYPTQVLELCLKKKNVKSVIKSQSTESDLFELVICGLKRVRGRNQVPGSLPTKFQLSITDPPGTKRSRVPGVG